jgi:glutamyl-tRNA synthetase
MHSFSKTRIAPTPSGFLHAGNAFNFLQTAALAKQSGARVLLRIDDMDRDRYRPAYVNDIFETLDFLGIHWQEGPKQINDF